MKYTKIDTHEHIVTPESFKERLQLLWFIFRNPSRVQHRITFKDGEQWLHNNCNHVILNETKNLTKVRE